MTLESNSLPVQHSDSDIPGAKDTVLSVFQHNPLLAACILILAAALFAYWQLPRHEFINLDDKIQIVENNDLHHGLSAGNMGWMFSVRSSRDYWRPLTWLSLALNYQLHGLKPWGYHLFNLLLHITNALLLLFFLHKATGRLWPSALAALLFALHPLNVEAVAWAVQRKSTLSTFFLMLSLLAYVRYAASPRMGSYLMVCLAFFCALASKATVMPMVFALFLLDFWPLGRLGGASAPAGGRLSVFGAGAHPLRGLVLEKIPLAILCAVAGIFVYMSYANNGQIIDTQRVSLMLRLQNGLVAYAAFLGKALWPARLSVFYPMPESMGWFKPLAALCLLAGVTAVCFRARKAHPYLIVGWLWFLGVMTPYLGVFFRTGVFPAMVDRAFYVPGIGLFIAAIWGVRDIVLAWRIPKPVYTAVCVALLVALAWACKHQVSRWQNSLALFTQAAENTKDNYLAHNCLGIEYKSMGNLDAALGEFEQVVAIKPDYTKARFNLASVLADKGKPEEALAQLEQALSHSPNPASVHCKIGALLADMGKLQEAREHLLLAGEMAPEDSNVYDNLGLLCLRQQRYDEALEYFRTAIAVDPGNYNAFNNLGSTLAGQGKMEQAAQFVGMALEMAPRSESALNNMANIMIQAGNPQAGVMHLGRMLEINPGNWEARMALAMILLKEGNEAGALEHLIPLSRAKPDDFGIQYIAATALIRTGRLEDAYTCLLRALEIKPDHAGVHNSLGTVLYSLGYADDALQHFEKALAANPEYEPARQNLAMVRSRNAGGSDAQSSPEQLPQAGAQP